MVSVRIRVMLRVWGVVCFKVLVRVSYRLVSNAFAFASANANAAFALAFDCPVVDAFAFDSSAFALALAFDSNAFDWNQMRNKCESNETVLLLLCYIMIIFFVGFAWNKYQEDQYKNL